MVTQKPNPYIPQTMDNLHPDIIESEMQRRSKGYSDRIVSVTDPSIGILGDTPEDGIVNVEYNCTDKNCSQYPKPHTNLATYGPEIIHSYDDCKNCGVSRWRFCACYEPRNEEELDWSHFELYGD